MSSKRILAFDLGKASIGYCLRDESDIIALDAWVLPADFASVSDLRDRKHAYRNRLAHKQREEWFSQNIWLKAGLPDYRQPEAWEAVKQHLPRYRNDKKLWTREFPKNGDETVFSSCLLRIALIEGKPLEPWQIWKALWSAIQKRGYFYYDWKTEPKGLESLEENVLTIESQRDKLQAQIDDLEELKKRASREEKPEIIEQIQDLKTRLKAWNDEYKDVIKQVLDYEQLLNDTVGHLDYRFPCYLEAAKQGLWRYDGNTFKPETKLQVDAHADTLKKDEQMVPRSYRIKEFKKLWEQAQQQLPALQAFDVEYVLYGETKRAFATAWHSDYQEKRGKAELDWQGVLGQKVPRFDNRIIAKCQLYPGILEHKVPARNVCKAADPLNLTFSLLSQIKNLRFVDVNGETNQAILKGSFRPLFEKLCPKFDPPQSQYVISMTKLTKAMKEEFPDFQQFMNLNAKEAIKLNASGRSRFCRPALTLMNDILLNGINPADVDISQYIQPGVKNGITREEVEKALKRLSKDGSWENFHVADRREEIFEEAQRLANDMAERDKRIAALIGGSNNPVVRHRLTLFKKLLDDLTQQYDLMRDKPDHVVLEFVRGVDSGFEGKKKAETYEQSIRRNEAKNDEIQLKLQESGFSVSQKNIVRLKLFQEQGGICVYSGKKLIESQLENYEIEHIVPTSEKIHSDALWNKVLVEFKTNREKNDQTPYDYFKKKGNDVWEEYVHRVEAIYKDGNKKKKTLLLSPEARQKVESYNGLAETSSIARLVQQIIALYFAFPQQNVNENRKIFVVDGALTARIRSRYDLNKILLTEKQLKERDTLLQQLKETPLSDSQQRTEIRKKLKAFDQKNRSNDKHHALDAFCVSFSQSIHRTPPNDIHPEGYWIISNMEKFKPVLKAKLADLFPKTVRRNKKELYPEETIYRYNSKEWIDNDKGAITVHRDILAYLGDDKDGKKIEKLVDTRLQKYLKEKRAAITDAAEWKSFLDPGNKKQECRHPVWGSVVKSIEVIASELSGQPTADKDGRLVAGEYKDYGPKNDPRIHQTKGQFKRTKQHKGQIFYKNPRDSKDKWRVFPVYGYMRLSDARTELKAKGYTLYRDGELFYSSAMVRLLNAARGGELPAGIYKLRTVMAAGKAKLEKHDGDEVQVSVNDMIQAGVTLN